MDRNQWKWLALSVIFSVVVLALVLYFTIDENTINYLTKLQPQYLLAALILHILSLCAWALRLKFMSKSLGYKVPFLHCLNMVFANLLIAAVTPSQAGGEPVRIHELYRADVPLGDATAIVIMERVLDGILLGIIGGAAMLMLWLGSEELGLSIALPLFFMWAMITGFVILFAYSVKNPVFLKNLIKKFSGWFTKRWHAEKVEKFTGRIDSEVDNFNSALKNYVSHSKIGLVWGTLFTVFYWFSEFFIASLILMGLGEGPHIVESFVAQIIIAIIMMIPLTPGSSGIAELSATSLYSLFVPSSIVGIFVVIWRILLYYLNIFLGIFGTLIIVKREVVRKAIKDKISLKRD
ncbi:flippase-like domain-containing protein [Methanomicrobium antiquum]|uniref:Flippase-like domain-containing protein n=1 Tax=Methanomicrobium antiquum TaxID=487686 RepID=A0AAF0FLB5_9EURY|nr:flippase-like domain-containing protein [Methanomicrobium antiquum]MDD3976621.1 flippase-like domain-containing protein [Methanomicrobium sp.]WFN36015.1 flippase-like domain-containing protein [Methanomicrobium antiquum]